MFKSHGIYEIGDRVNILALLHSILLSPAAFPQINIKWQSNMCH